MFKKLAVLLAITAGFMSAASAQQITNAGFEAGNTSNWFGSSPITANTGSTVVSYSIIDADGFGNICNCTIQPADGSYYGLWAPTEPTTAGSTTSAVINFGSGSPTTSLQTVWLRLITGDFNWPDANDTVTVSFLGTSGSYSVQGQNMATTDSGWTPFIVPIGTTGLQLNVNDINEDGYINTPLVAIDYSLSPIPEPSAITMMLAGLGFVGFKSRRRQAAKSAAVAAC